jgi:hypothetical protein
MEIPQHDPGRLERTIFVGDLPAHSQLCEEVPDDPEWWAQFPVRPQGEVDLSEWVADHLVCTDCEVALIDHPEPIRPWPRVCPDRKAAV